MMPFPIARRGPMERMLRRQYFRRQARRWRMIRLAPLPLRVTYGLIMMVHGQQKLFGESKESFADVVASLGVPQAQTVAKGVSILEFFGGLALIAGLFTRPIALLLAGQFAYVTFKMKFNKGFSAYEFDLALLGGLLSLVLTGGGAGSLDRVLSGRGRA